MGCFLEKNGLGWMDRMFLLILLMIFPSDEPLAVKGKGCLRVD